MRVSANLALCSNYTAIGNSLNPSNPDIAMGSEVVAEGNEANEGSCLTNRENQDNFSPLKLTNRVNQSMKKVIPILQWLATDDLAQTLTNSTFGF